MSIKINEHIQLINLNKTNAARISLNAKYMHDVRNYIQTLADLSKNMDSKEQDSVISSSNFNTDSKKANQQINQDNLKKFSNNKQQFDQNYKQSNNKYQFEYNYQQSSDQYQFEYNYQQSSDQYQFEQNQKKVDININQDYAIKKEVLTKKELRKLSNSHRLKDQVNNRIADFSFDNESIQEEEVEKSISDIKINSIKSSSKEPTLKNENSGKSNLSDFKNLQDSFNIHSNNRELKDKIKELKLQCSNSLGVQNIIEFINQKICFLYHIDLTQENIQKIKNIYIKSEIIFEQFSCIMKILFTNKNSLINFRLKSSVSNFLIDIYMFKYLVCQMGSVLHENFISQFEIFIEIDTELNGTCEQITIKIRIDYHNSHENLVNLNDYIIFHNIILNIAPAIKSTYTQDSNSQNLQLKQINNCLSDLTDDNYNFDQSVNIKKSTITNYRISETNLKDNQMYKRQFYSKPPNIKGSNSSINFNNILSTEPTYHSTTISTNKQLKSSFGYLFLNLDDEINILSMNKNICEKMNISLIVCNHDQELLGLIMRIGTDYMGEINKLPIVILLDHILDGIQGYDVMEKVKDKQNTFGLDIKFILLSSTEDQIVFEKQKQLGVEKFITKPLNKSKIMSIIEYLKVKYEKNQFQLKKNILRDSI